MRARDRNHKEKTFWMGAIFLSKAINLVSNSCSFQSILEVLLVAISRLSFNLVKGPRSMSCNGWPLFGFVTFSISSLHLARACRISCVWRCADASMEEGKLILDPIFWNENQNFQFSVHVCNKAVLRQLQHIFPDLNLFHTPPPAAAAESPSHHENQQLIYAIPTLQHAKYDLVNLGEEIEQEKDDLLENVSEKFHPP